MSSPRATARPACVDLPAFPLQLCARAHPEWAGHPVVVVAEDAPQAPCLWVNEAARTAGVWPGMRYAAALALTGRLRAGVACPEQVAAGVAEVTRRLRRFSPEIEACADEPGVWWVNAGGLHRLHPSVSRWARLVRRGLGRAGLEATVVVGWTRFGTYAVARQAPGLQVLRDAAAERTLAHRVPLARIAVAPAARDTLAKLGVRTVGGLLQLPAEGLRRRFGAALARWHQLARDAWAHDGVEAPLRPEAPPEPLRARVEFEWAEGHLLRLLREWRRVCEPLLAQLAARGGAAAALRVVCRLDRAPVRTLEVRPAEPTLDVVALLHLLELQLERTPLVAGVTEAECTLLAAPATAEQLRLFAERAGRDRRAADRALARLRAEFGETAVVRAELRDGHLPEAMYAWTPCVRVAAPEREATPVPCAAPDVPVAGLVRRLLERPQPLPPPAADGAWHLVSGPAFTGAPGEPVVRRCGPYVVAGGWWATPVHREYHFAETADGRVCWVYWDAERDRWFLQGWVE